MTQTANGETISRTSDGRVSEIIFSDGEKNTYKYDSQGHVTQASYSHNDRAWSVVRQQNGTYQEIDGNGKPLKGKYDSLSVDSAGNETKVSGKLSTTYNIDGSKVVSEKDANGFPRPLHVRDANGNQRDYTYNSAGQIAHLNYTDGHNGYNDAWVRKGDGTYENYKELKDGNYEDTGRNLPIVAAYADGTYTETDDQDNVQVYRTDGTIKPA
jgi:YD repeat-containing protein